MATIDILVVTPEHGFRLARNVCVELHNKIKRLNREPLAPNESIDDRARSLAVLAVELASAFRAMDEIARSFDPADFTSSPRSPSSDTSSVPQGCVAEGDPTTN